MRFSITVSTWIPCIKSEKATSYNVFTRSRCPSHTLQNKSPQELQEFPVNYLANCV